MPRDREYERVQAAMRAERIAQGIEAEEEPPVISTPNDRRDGNGKRWAWDTLGKGIGGVLTVILLGLLALIATGRAWAIYGLPPRVDRLEDQAKAQAQAQTISLAAIDRLTAALERAEKREMERKRP